MAANNKRILALLLSMALLVLPGASTFGETVATQNPLLTQWYQIGAQLRQNGTYPYVELRRGDAGYEVIALQTRLFELNYYDKEIVPVFGSGSEGAMRRFEKTNGLSVNGWASVEDQQALFMSGALPLSGTTPRPVAGVLFDSPADEAGETASPSLSPTATSTVSPQSIPPVSTVNPGNFITLAPTATPTMAPQATVPPFTTLDPQNVIPGSP